MESLVSAAALRSEDSWVRQKRASNLFHECKAAKLTCDSQRSWRLSCERVTLCTQWDDSDTHLVTGFSVSHNS